MVSTAVPRTMNRRTLIAGSAATLAAATALAGCGSETKESNSIRSNAGAALPTYLPYSGLDPDLPATKEGVDAGFYRFPTKRPKVVSDKPGTGETLTGMARIYYAVPPGVSRNSYWAGLNDRLGVDLKLQMVADSDYSQKFPTVIAGNDLPDLMSIEVVANFPSLLDKMFTPLDEYLSGDAIKDYPNLANLPTNAWKTTIYNGHIYGIPIPRGRVGNYCYIRQDLFEAAGLPVNPKGYDELIAVGKELTNPQKRRWAYAVLAHPRGMLAIMNNEPNNWREEGGKLTSTYETDEFKQTVSDLITMWKSGVIHPDAFSDTQPALQLFNSGTCAINGWSGYTGWTQNIAQNLDNPGYKLGLMQLTTRDGPKLAPWHLGPGLFTVSPFCALKKQPSKDKIKLGLRVLNWLAAPFGTEEYLYRIYGQPGVDHTTTTSGDPTLTKTGQTNTVLPLRYLADSPSVLYQPGRPQDVDTQYRYQSAEVPTGIQDPTVGLFSNTYATKNSPADKTINDGINQVVRGRRRFSELKDLIATWRTSAGDAMRREYEEQLQHDGGTK